MHVHVFCVCLYPCYFSFKKFTENILTEKHFHNIFGKVIALIFDLNAHSKNVLFAFPQSFQY
jgi:hypothetical protein